MGLDMYLDKKCYIGHDKRPSLKIAGIETPVDGKRVQYILEEVGYWRKANAVHQWFVNNIQDGIDDCRSYYVSAEQLQALLDTVNKVLEASELVEGKVANGQTFKDGKFVPILEDGKYIKDSTVAEELLPATEGFFFGSTDYDQYYYQDLVNTKQILEEALKDPAGEYEYTASW